MFLYGERETKGKSSLSHLSLYYRRMIINIPGAGALVCFLPAQAGVKLKVRKQKSCLNSYCDSVIPDVCHCERPGDQGQDELGLLVPSLCDLQTVI